MNFKVGDKVRVKVGFRDIPSKGVGVGNIPKRQEGEVLTILRRVEVPEGFYYFVHENNWAWGPDWLEKDLESEDDKFRKLLLN